MPNTMMGYGGVQPQRAATPAMPIRQDYAGPLPQGGGFGATLPGYRPGMPVVDRGGKGVPLPPKLGGGMNYIGGSPNFDESTGAYRNPLKPMPDGRFMIPGPNDFSMGPGGAMTRYTPPAPPTLGVTPIRGPFPTPPAPPTLGVTPIRGPFPFPTPRELNNGTIYAPRELNNGTITAPRELNNGTIYAPRELNNGTISFPTQTPDQMQAMLDQQRNQFLAQQQSIPPNAGIAALPMDPAMMQRLGAIANLAGGVRR